MMREKKFRITFNAPVVLSVVVILFLGQQVWDGIMVQDNISNMAHIVGGIIGGLFGYGFNMRPRFSRFER